LPAISGPGAVSHRALPSGSLQIGCRRLFCGFLAGERRHVSGVETVAHVWSGVAVQESRLLYLRGDDIRRLMERMPGFALGIVEGLVQKGKCYSALLQMLGTRSVVERLAQLLIIIAESDGVPDGDAVVIGRALTHEELANMVGSTRQWVTSTMRKFQQKRLLAVEGRRLVLRDIYGLREIVGIC